MENLTKLFALPEHAIVSIIGSGGKTSLMLNLAHESHFEKILMTTTTKIFLPKEKMYDNLFLGKWNKKLPIPKGVTLAGTLVEDTQPMKLSQPATRDLLPNLAKFDQVYLEADGSKTFPLKGWADFEPVVIPQSTTTIGVVPITALSLVVSDTTVHRLPLFLEQTGMVVGEKITIDSLVQICCQQLFKRAHGQCVLFISQVETAAQYLQANELAAAIKQQVPCQISRIIAGSSRLDFGKSY